MHPTIAGMMHNYNRKFSELHIRNMCNLKGVKTYQLPSVKCFHGENRKLCMCNMFTLKQCREKLCMMAHLLLMRMDKAYTEQLVNMLNTAVSVPIYKNRSRKKRMTIPKNPE